MDVVGRLSLGALVVALAIGLAAALGTRFHLWPYAFCLTAIVPWFFYAGLAAFALGLLWVLAAIFTSSSSGAGFGVVSFLGAIALLAMPLYTLYMVRVARAIPPIHDISTDIEHPPAFSALLAQRPGAVNPPDYDGPRLVRTDNGKSYSTAALQKKFYGDIHSYALFTTPAKLFQRAVNAANAMGWNVVSVAPDAEGGSIEATDTTLLFGLTDDIAIRVRPAGVGARMDIRSKSRIGVSDYGENAARIRAYIKRLATS
ncbi:MAG TPA: DUF1499 domain-containing protein [Rhizomicrobium sp.]|jgi:hypothetical protein